MFDGRSVTEAARLICATRSTVVQWRGLYEEYGEARLEPACRSRRPWTVTEELVSALEAPLDGTPEAYTYVRSRWSSGLVAQELEPQHGVEIHASRARRLLPRLGFGYRRAPPVLARTDPSKNTKLRAIARALRRRCAVEVFYVDETDVDFNTRVGSAWMRCGQQNNIPTPGPNIAHYLAGAVHAHSGGPVWLDHAQRPPCCLSSCSRDSAGSTATLAVRAHSRQLRHSDE